MGFMVPAGRAKAGALQLSTRFRQSARQACSVGPRLRSPCSEKRSAARGMTTQSVAMSAELWSYEPAGGSSGS